MARPRSYLQGKGTYSGAPTTINLRGGSLLSLRQANVRYPLELRWDVGQTHIAMKGTVDDPISFAGLDGMLDLRTRHPGNSSSSWSPCYNASVIDRGAIMSSEGLHAPRERLSKEAIALHQAISSLMEELEAADWYRQRADDCDDATLKEVLLHNMREEIEHAAMVLEWIRRNNRDFDHQLRTYLFRDGAILELEKSEAAKD
jgi:uncharacterized protein